MNPEILTLHNLFSRCALTNKMRINGKFYNFKVYNHRKIINKINNESVYVEFPDSKENKRLNRIGYLDSKFCPWNNMGYSYDIKSAVNVDEYDPKNDSWNPKILMININLAANMMAYDRIFQWHLSRNSHHRNIIGIRKTITHEKYSSNKEDYNLLDVFKCDIPRWKKCPKYLN